MEFQENQSSIWGTCKNYVYILKEINSVISIDNIWWVGGISALSKKKSIKGKKKKNGNSLNYVVIKLENISFFLNLYVS